MVMWEYNTPVHNYTHINTYTECSKQTTYKATLGSAGNSPHLQHNQVDWGIYVVLFYSVSNTDWMCKYVLEANKAYGAG